MRVKIGKMGDDPQEIEDLPEGSTIRDVLEAADMLDDFESSSKGYKLYVNNVKSNLETVVSDGDLITVVPVAEGG